MGAQTDNAFEIPQAGIILNDTAGVYAGSSTPDVDVPDAPQGSIYITSGGLRYTRKFSTGSGVAEDWVVEDPEGTGGGASVSLSWRFSTTTTAANPGSKRIRFNNATPASVTEIYINDTTNNNVDASALLNALSAGDRIFVQESADATAFLLATVNTVTDNIGWFTLGVTPITVGALPSNNTDVGVLLIFGGGGGGGVPGDQSSVQARRTTALTFTPAWVDVDLDTTDFENDDTIVDHDDTLRDRLVFKEAGPYWVTYRVDTDQPVPTSNFQTLLQARIRVNDTTVVNGSDSEEQALEDASLVGAASVWPSLKAGFVFNATASDFLTLQIQHTESDAGSNMQASAGRVVFTATRMSGATGPQGAPGSGGSVIRVGKTYAIAGEIKVPVGQVDFIVPFFVSLAAGQTADLVKARHQINVGTSVTCKLQKNGIDIAGFTGISVTTTPADTNPTDVVLADNDELALVVTAVSGTPQNMTFTLFIEHTG